MTYFTKGFRLIFLSLFTICGIEDIQGQGIFYEDHPQAATVFTIGQLNSNTAEQEALSTSLTSGFPTINYNVQMKDSGPSTAFWNGTRGWLLTLECNCEILGNGNQLNGINVIKKLDFGTAINASSGSWFGPISTDSGLIGGQTNASNRQSEFFQNDDTEIEYIGIRIQNGSGYNYGYIKLKAFSEKVGSGNETSIRTQIFGTGVHKTINETIRAGQIIESIDFSTTVTPSNATADPVEYTLDVGDSMPISYTFNSGLSQDTAEIEGIVGVFGTTGIVSVSNGEILAEAGGSTTVKIAGASGGAESTKTIKVIVNVPQIDVTGIKLSASGGADGKIQIAGGSLSYIAEIEPSNANNQEVVWVLQDPNNLATSTVNGNTITVTADNKGNGNVTVVATAVGDNSITVSKTITISGQNQPISGLKIKANPSSITVKQGSVNLSAEVTPSNVIDASVTWSIVDRFSPAYLTQNTAPNKKTPATATVRATGASDGFVKVRVTSQENPSIFDEVTINITNQSYVPVTGLTIKGPTEINTKGGKITLVPEISPSDATDKSVTWILQSQTLDTGLSGNIATFEPSTGVLTALNDGNGTVEIRAIPNGTSTHSIVESFYVTITNQDAYIPVTGMSISPPGTSTISTPGGSVTFTVNFTPPNASNQGVEWQFLDERDKRLLTISPGSIMGEYIVTAKNIVAINGTVKLRASSLDTESVTQRINKDVFLSNQDGTNTAVTRVTINGGDKIDTPNGTLQLTASVLPANATIQDVIWNISSGDDLASIDNNGLVTALGTENGEVIVEVSAVGDSEKKDTHIITLTNQVSRTLTGISITGSNTISTINGSVSLSVVYEPATTDEVGVTWSVMSGGDWVTQRDNILIANGKGNGEVVVRATSTVNPSIYADYTITISNQPVPLEAIIIARQDPDRILEVGDEFTVTVTFVPAGASIKAYSFLILTKDIIQKIGDNTFKILKEGEVRLRATQNLVGRPEINSEDLVFRTGQQPTALQNEHTTSKGLIEKIYPNPVSQTLKLQFSRKATGKILFIYDYLGTKVWQSTAKIEMSIDVSTFQNGLYYLKIGDMISNVKLIKY